MKGPERRVVIEEYTLPGRIATTGQIREYPLRISGARPHAITAAADGALWFTQWGSNHIGRITVAGEVSEYAIPTPGSEPHGIAPAQTARYGLRKKRAISDASYRRGNVLQSYCNPDRTQLNATGNSYGQKVLL